MFLKFFALTIACIAVFMLSSCRTQPSPEIINNNDSVPIEDTADPNDKDQNSLNIYFNNIVFDPDMLDCSNVYPVDRMLENRYQYEELLNLLIQGPTAEEKLEGYISNFPPNTLLNEVKVESNIAYVDFDILQVGGSCATMAIRAQITSTLTQYDAIDDVVVSIQGQTEGALEP